MKAVAVLLSIIMQATSTVQSGSESQPTSSLGAHHTTATAYQLAANVGTIQWSYPEPAEPLVSTGLDLEDNAILREGTLRNNGADVDEVVPSSGAHTCDDMSLFHQYVGVLRYLQSPTRVFPAKLSSVITRETPCTGQYLDAYSLAHDTSTSSLAMTHSEHRRLHPLALREISDKATSILSNVLRDLGVVIESKMLCVLGNHIFHKSETKLWMRIVDVLQHAGPYAVSGTRWTNRNNGEFIIDLWPKLLTQCNCYQSKYTLPTFKGKRISTLNKMRTRVPPVLLSRRGTRTLYSHMENAFNMANPQVAAYIAFSSRYHRCVGNYLDDEPSAGLINRPPDSAAVSHVVIIPNVRSASLDLPLVLAKSEPARMALPGRRTSTVSRDSTPKRPRVDLDDETPEKQP